MSVTLAFADRTLADIAATLPGATAIFRSRKLDFCCGGRVRLAEAAAARGLALDDLEAALEAVVAQALPPRVPQETGALIDLIETRYHAGHRQALPELIRLARRVEAAHKGHPAVPVGLVDLLERMAMELEAHMQKEEQVLFPLLRNGGFGMAGQPIAVLLAEHDDHGAHLRALEHLTGGFVTPPDACPTWQALYSGASQLADTLKEHIHRGNNVLFPRFAD